MKQNSSIQMITDYEGDMPKLDIQVDGEIPVFVTRNLVMFPGILSPILVGRKPTLELVRHLEENPNTIIAIVSQKDSNINEPQEDDIYTTGIYARFVRAFDMPGNYEGNNRTVILQGLGKCKIKKITTTTPYMKGYTVAIPEEAEPEKDKEFSTAVEDMKVVVKEYIHGSDDIPDDSQFALDNINNPVIAVNYICSTMPFPVTDKIQMLEENSIKDRLFSLMKVLNREIQFQHLRQDIRSKTREDLDEQQREYFLHQQIKNIKEELGDGDSAPDKKELLEKAKNKKWPEEVAKVFQKELDKLETLNPQSPDYSVQVNYLRTMVSLPWDEYTKDDLDLKRAKRILDKDHYGMEKVKERILEYIAVLQLRGNLKDIVRLTLVLCLDVSSRISKRQAHQILFSSLTRLIRLLRTLLTATLHQPCWRFSTLSRTMPSMIITWIWTTIYQRSYSLQRPMTSIQSHVHYSTAWSLLRFQAISRKKRLR